MPTRKTAPIGAPCWIDLLTSDADASRRFYTALFGWEAQEPSAEFGGYFMFTLRGVPIAGGMTGPADAAVTDGWATHLATDDIAKTLELAAAEGGQVAFGPDRVGDLGRNAMVIDPGGAGIGIWEPGTFEGFSILFERSAPCWHELHTTDYDAAVRFYRNVFRWETATVSDSPEFRYTTLAHGDRFLAGILDASDAPPAAGSHWVVYLGAEPDEAAALVEKLGGAVLEPPVDTAYGRVAKVCDPNGAEFKIMKGNTEMPDTV